MARINDVKLRLEWRSRVIDHEGDIDGSGGIARYLQLCEKLNLDLEYVKSCKGLLPATRFAVDAYVNFVENKIDFPLFNLAETINLVMKIAQNNEVRIPIIKVVANPLIGPEPKIYRIIPVKRVVTLASIIEV